MTAPIVAMLAFAAGIVLCVAISHGKIASLEVQKGDMKFLVTTYAEALKR